LNFDKRNNVKLSLGKRSC